MNHRDMTDWALEARLEQEERRAMIRGRIPTLRGEPNPGGSIWLTALLCFGGLALVVAYILWA